MFKKFFLRDDEEDEVYETVDPVLEQRRKEKFSTPLIYNDDEIVEEKKPEVKKTSVKKSQPLETNSFHRCLVLRKNMNQKSNQNNIKK